MTVEQLMEVLKTMPPAAIVVRNDDCSDLWPLETVAEIELVQPYEGCSWRFDKRTSPTDSRPVTAGVVIS